MSKSFHVVCPRCDAVNRVPQDRPASQAVCGSCKARLFEGHPIELNLMPAIRPFSTRNRAADVPIRRPPIRAVTGAKFSMAASDQRDFLALAGLQ